MTNEKGEKQFSNSFSFHEKINLNTFGIFFISKLNSLEQVSWYKDFLFFTNDRPWSLSKKNDHSLSLYIQKFYSRNFPIMTILNFNKDTFQKQDFKNYFDIVFKNSGAVLLSQSEQKDFEYFFVLEDKLIKNIFESYMTSIQETYQKSGTHLKNHFIIK